MVLIALIYSHVRQLLVNVIDNVESDSALSLIPRSIIYCNIDLLEAYKIIHSEEDNSKKVLVRQIERAGAATRTTADPWKLSVPRARLDIRKNNFASRVPEKWNKLPLEIKNAPNLISFKNALKRYHICTQVDDRT